ncbi:MAG: hypothetical protein ACXAB0_03390 [Candidatus Thorarchaeota archaeon]
MLGKGLIKIIGFIIAGAIALAAGAELLASVVSVVLSFRGGNPFPLISIVIITVVLIRLVQRRSEETPVKMILNIAAYAATGYVAVVAFVIGLPYGLVAGVVASVIAVIACSIMGDPSSLFQQIQIGIPGISLGMRFDGVSKRMVPFGNGNSFALNTAHNVMLVDESDREKLVQLMRDRPRLPVSLTRYEDRDVLFITTDDDSIVERVSSLLTAAGITSKGSPTPLLTEVVQMVPILDEQNGFPMRNYRLARDEKSVSDLLSSWPVRMTVFPSETGVLILVPDHVSTGLNVEKLTSGYESDILLNRDFTSLLEVVKPDESTA